MEDEGLWASDELTVCVVTLFSSLETANCPRLKLCMQVQFGGRMTHIYIYLTLILRENYLELIINPFTADTIKALHIAILV